MSSLRIVFFGTPEIAATILEELKASGIVPALVVTNPDRPVGRKQTMTPPPVKVWAEKESVEVLQPEDLKDEQTLAPLFNTEWDLFIVAAYGGILPKKLLELPEHGVLNVHPSLLPKFRGASPIRSAILSDERETGVTIMQMDEKMDHGPIVAQARVEIAKEDWPLSGHILDDILAHAGGELLAETIPAWLEGAITPEEQDHEKATYCQKISKDMGELDLKDDPYQNLLKIRAFDGWPGTFFYDENGKRVKITEAELTADGSLKILKVIPEGKKEIDFKV